MKIRWNKGLSILASLVLVLSMFPVQALAEVVDEVTSPVELTSAEQLLKQFNAEKQAEAEGNGATADVLEPAVSELLASDIPSSANTERVTLDAPQSNVLSLDSALDDSDELLEGYIEQAFSAALTPTQSSNLGFQPTYYRPSTGLTGNDAIAYTELKKLIAEVAAGTRTSTVFEIPASKFTTQTSWTASELGVSAIVSGGQITSEASNAVWEKLNFDMTKVLHALLVDCPYEMYWCDKTAYRTPMLPNLGANYSNGQWVISIPQDAVVKVSLYVSADYSATGATNTYNVDATVGQRISTAVTRAANVAAGGANLSAYDRLAYFKNWICTETDYNEAAVLDPTTPYGDPWQLVYVFDNDESTTVVCEGYSKAFQYLCDLAQIPGVYCYSVTGTMYDSEGGGLHMWNLVHMDDGNVYLVDVTNCDEGTAGYPDELFIKPYSSGSLNTYYSFADAGISYAYDDETFDTYTAEELTVSSTAYVAPAAPTVSDGWTQLGTCEYQIVGDTWTVRPLGNGTSGVLPDTYGYTFPDVNNSNVKHVVFESGVKSAESLYGAFGGCSNLESIDFGDFDTSAATDMACMFMGCTSLSTIDVSSLDVSNVVDMIDMFYGSGITSIDLTQWNPVNVQCMRLMFCGCTSLESVNLANLSAESLTDAMGMFDSCSSLVSINLSGLSMPLLAEMTGFFGRCSSLRSITLDGLSIPSVTSMDSLFIYCSSLESVDLSSVLASSLTDMGGMFGGCTSLESVSFGDFDTSGVTDMHELFGGCSALTSIDLSDLDTSSVTDMTKMFFNCTALEALDLSVLNTSSVTNMSYLLCGCTSLADVTLSDIDTSSVTNMECMFIDCQALQSVDLSSFTTSALENMMGMFWGCQSLLSVDLSGFNTSSVTNMGYLFNGCKSLETVNLSNLDMDSVESMNRMFYDCNALKSIDLSGFNTEAIEDLSYFFYCCSSLEELNLSSFDTSNVTNMAYMFYGCSALKSLDIYDFDTSLVTNMNAMFYNCWSLNNLNLDNIVTTSVTDMGWMFANCTSLTSLDLSNFDTTNVVDMNSMFTGCSALQTVVVGESFVQPITDGLWSAPDGQWRAASDGLLYAGYELAHRGVADVYTRVTDLSGAWVCVDNQTYTGSLLTPEAVVVLEEQTLVAGVDYTVTYTNNIEVGTATATIEGIGSYTGEASTTFEILPPEFGASASTEAVYLSETASFVCAVTGAGDAGLTYQWQYSTDGGTTWKNLGWASAKTATLTAEATAYRVEKQLYRCVVTASDGRTTETDSIAFDIIPTQAELVASAATTPVALGETASFTCTVTGAEGAALSYQWFYSADQGTTWKKLGWTGATTDTLVAQATAYRVATQQYQCVVTAADGRTATTNAITFEISAELPELSASAATSPVALGEMASFTCMVTGADGATLSYQWQYTTDGTTWKNLGWTGAKTATLSAEATAYRAEKQQYRCVVTASDGRTATTNAITFDIVSESAELVVTAQATPVAIGETTTFTCTVEGASPEDLTYQWQYTADGGQTWKNLGWASAKTATLSAEATAYRVEKQQYRCVVTAADGRVATTDAIGFEIANTLTATAETSPVAIGEMATFTCTVEGADAADCTYQWYYTTDNGDTWKKLGWESAKTDTLTAQATAYRVQSQQYCCVVTASDGRTATTEAIGFEISGA